MDEYLGELLRTLGPRRLSVGSGVYAAVDPRLSMRLNSRGEYEYVGIDRSYSGDARRLLEVSAFGGLAKTEDVIAQELFGEVSPAMASHPTLGYHLGTFAGWDLDSAARLRSSSGGLTTWVAEELLARGEIDAVIHIKRGSPGEGALFSYQVSRTPEEVRAGARSKYYPGELSESLKVVLADQGRYAITAIPSIAYEIRLLQAADERFRKSIRFIIGLICGHQKTAHYATYLGWRAGIEPGQLLSIDFRHKVPGRQANDYATEFVTKGGTTTVLQKDLRGTDWGWGFFKSNFSDFTDDAFNETADVVMGDAWIPRYVKDSAGTNIVIVRNPVIARMLDAAVEDGRIHLEPISEEDIVASQRSLVRHSIEERPYRLRWTTDSDVRARLRNPAREVSLSRSRRLIQRARWRMTRRSHIAFERALEAGNLAVFDREIRWHVIWYKVCQRLLRYEKRFARGRSVEESRR